MKISKNSVLYSVALLALSNILLQLLSFVFRIIISRLTGAEGMGVYQLIFPFYSVIITFSLSGLCLAVSRISSEYYTVGNIWGVKNLFGLSIKIFIFLFAIITVFTLVFSRQIADVVLGDSRTYNALMLLLPCLFFTGFENILKSLFYGIKNVKPQVSAELLEQVVRMSIAAFLLIYFKPNNAAFSVTLIAIAMVISEVFSSSLLILFYKNSKQLKTIKSAKTNHLLKSIVKIALPVSAAGLANSLLSSANAILIPHRLIASGMPSHQAIGSFGILMGMAMPLIMLPSAFIFALCAIIVPKLSEIRALNDSEQLKQKVGKAIFVTGLISIPIIAVMLPVFPTVCELIYKQKVSSALFTPLAIATVFVFYQIITASILNGLGLQKSAAFSVVLSGIVQLIITYFAVANPKFQLFGFALGYLLSAIVGVLVNLAFIVRKTHLKIEWFRWFVFPILSATLAGLITRFIYICLSQSGFNMAASLLIALATGGATYIAVVQLQGISVKGYIKTLIPKNA
jgi:stage V sporulation protein B